MPAPPPPPRPDSVYVPRAKARSSTLSAKSQYQADKEKRTKKYADVDGRRIYGDARGWRARQRTPLDALADLLLTPFPPELRGKIRRSVANTAKAFDDLLIRLGGGGQKALE